MDTHTATAGNLAKVTHEPDLGQFMPACKCGRTFATWRGQGIHETAARRNA